MSLQAARARRVEEAAAPRGSSQWWWRRPPCPAGPCGRGTGSYWRVAARQRRSRGPASPGTEIRTRPALVRPGHWHCLVRRVLRSRPTKDPQRNALPVRPWLPLLLNFFAPPPPLPSFPRASTTAHVSPFPRVPFAALNPPVVNLWQQGRAQEEGGARGGQGRQVCESPRLCDLAPRRLAAEGHVVTHAHTRALAFLRWPP